MVYSSQTIADCCSGKLLCGSGRDVWNIVVTRSELAGPNTVFFAINGKKNSYSDKLQHYGVGGRHDGHDYIQIAISNGCKVIVIDNMAAYDKYHVAETVTFILANDSVDALYLLTKKIIVFKSIKSIAVTGSSGKTTTCIMLSKITGFRYLSRVRSTIVGLCLDIINDAKESEAIIVELQTDGPGQILTLADLLSPKVAAITAIHSAHIEQFGSEKNIFKEKISITNAIQKGGILVYNSDSIEHLDITRKDITTICYGKKNNGDLKIVNIHDSFPNIFDISYKDEILSITTENYGTGNLYATLGSIAIALSLGYTTRDISNSLINAESIPGRMRLLQGIDKSIIVDDSYNGNIYSLMLALNFLHKFKNKKRIAVLGGVLGQNATLGQEEIIQHALNTCDFVYTIGDQGKALFNKLLLSCTTHVAHFNSYIDFWIQLPYLNIDRTTIVLVKGPNCMHMERVVLSLLEPLSTSDI